MNRLKQVSFLVFLWMFFFIQSYGQDVQNQEEWIGKINDRTQNIQNLQADFEQIKHMSFLEQDLVSKGKFWFQQEDKIRWEYQDPYSYIIIMDQGKLTVKDNGEQYTTDLSSNKIFQQMNGLISGSIQGDLWKDQQHYSFEFSETTKYIIIRMLPKDEQLSAYLDYMEMHFDKENLDVEELLMHEPSGDYTLMKFYNRMLNQEMNEDVFK